MNSKKLLKTLDKFFDKEHRKLRKHHDELAKLLIKLDSGFPNLGEVVLPSSELAIGEWKTYSVKFDMLLENPGFVVFEGMIFWAGSNQGPVVRPTTCCYPGGFSPNRGSPSFACRANPDTSPSAVPASTT